MVDERHDCFTGRHKTAVFDLILKYLAGIGKITATGLHTPGKIKANLNVLRAAIRLTKMELR